MKSAVVAVIFILFGFLANAQVKIDQLAPEISLPGLKDTTIHLSSFKGKVVLIDFWASWCAPCRASIPGIKKLYTKYKSQGFEVFAVSLDTKKQDWLKAVAQDKTNYTQVFAKGGFYSPTSDAYGVNQMPNSFLLDKAGKVVAVDLTGDQLENKIKELLK